MDLFEELLEEVEVNAALVVMHVFLVDEAAAELVHVVKDLGELGVGHGLEILTVDAHAVGTNQRFRVLRFE